MRIGRMWVSLIRTLQWKLVFIFVAITMVMMLFVYVFLNYGIGNVYYQNFSEGIENSFDLWVSAVGNQKDITISEIASGKGDSLEQYDLYVAFHINEYLSVTIFDKEKIRNKEKIGKEESNPIVFSSDSRYKEDKDNFLKDIELYSQNLLKYFETNEVENSKVLISTSSGDYYEYLKRDDDGKYAYYFMYDRLAWQDIISGFNNIILNSSLLAIIISLVLGFFLSKTITNPIVKIMHRAQNLAAGDFEQSLEVKSEDEIGKLTKAFNYMAKELKNTMNEQQKLDSMRKEFVANVSHELKTPITSIKSYSETLLDGGLDDLETTVKFLGVINTEADRMTRLVKDLLQLSRMDNQQMRWNMKSFNISKLILNVVERLQIQAKAKNQVLEVYLDGEICDVKGDRDRIEQVILNIIGNAIKYTPVGGEIKTYIRCLANDVEVVVEDTGIGIPAEDLPRIFERFYRVDKARSREMGGTGLGLAIAKDIVEAHGGSISAESELEEGTKILIKLPLAK